jgi:hypothetical protein
MLKSIVDAFNTELLDRPEASIVVGQAASSARSSPSPGDHSLSLKIDLIVKVDETKLRAAG